MALALGFVSLDAEFLVERIESTHSTWVFDTERMRFRRVPRGAAPDAPSLDRDWQPYYALEIDDGSGAFTVALNAERTKLLRAWRDDAGAQPPRRDGATGPGTAELEVETARQRPE